MLRYVQDVTGKFATWVKVVGMALTLLSAAVAYGKMSETVSANTKTTTELKTTTTELDARVQRNELEDAKIHTELTVTMGNVLKELQEIKGELKTGTRLQRSIYGNLIQNRTHVVPVDTTGKK